MDEARELTSLLTRAADGAGVFHPPPVEELTRRRREQSRSRATLTVVVSAVTVVAVALAVTIVSRGGPDPVADRTSRPSTSASAAPPVPVAALQGYRWSDLPSAPLDTRTAVASAWTGQQLIVWGGQSGASALRNDGASYDPTTSTWTKLAPSPLSPRSGAFAAWADGRFVVWGGYDTTAGHRAIDGASYTPSTRTWTKLPPAPVAAGDTAELLATGNDVLLLSIDASSEGRSLDAALYDPSRNTWRALPALAAPAGREILYGSAVDTGKAVLVWLSTTISPTGQAATAPTSFVDSYRLDMSSQTWSTDNLTPDQERSADQPLWTGTSVVLPQEPVYCGLCSRPWSAQNPGVEIDSRTGRRTVIPPGPTSGSNGSYVWTGAALLGVNMSSEGSEMTPGDTAAWDPTTGRWTRLGSAPFSGDGSSAVTVWTGKELLVWGIGLFRGKSEAPDYGYVFAPG